MSILDEWFGPRETVATLPALPKRCASVNVHPDRVVIELGLGKPQLAFRGAQREALLARLGKTWTPMGMGRSKNSAPVRRLPW